MFLSNSFKCLQFGPQRMGDTLHVHVPIFSCVKCNNKWHYMHKLNAVHTPWWYLCIHIFTCLSACHLPQSSCTKQFISFLGNITILSIKNHLPHSLNSSMYQKNTNTHLFLHFLFLPRCCWWISACFTRLFPFRYSSSNENVQKDDYQGWDSKLRNPDDLIICCPQWCFISCWWAETPGKIVYSKIVTIE